MELKNVYSKEIIKRGESYLDSVKYCIKINNVIYGKVEGSRTYKTEVDLDSLEGECSCPYGTNCKHAVALYLVYKNGDFSDAGSFIKNLNAMSKNELIELIISRLQDNPDLIIKHNIRKNAKRENFVREFKSKFSTKKIEEADAILSMLSFKQLLELQNYIDKNYEDLTNKLFEQAEYTDEYGEWDNEDYDGGLGELLEKLGETLVKNAIKEKEQLEVIKRISLHDAIIDSAQDFIDFKNQIKRSFSKEDYLKFLLNLKSPDIKEIASNINADNKHILFDSLPEKIALVKSIGNYAKDDVILFIVATYNKDISFLFNNFKYFDEAIKEDYEITEKLNEIVKLFKKNKICDESIAKKLLEQDENAEYESEQLKYLSLQINDFIFIRDNLDFDRLEEHVVLLDRLFEIDQKQTLIFIKNKKDLLGRHWSDIVLIFRFLKKNYNKKTIKDYIVKNKEQFTSSHLKNHLKDESIFIKFTKGDLQVEIK